MTEVYKPHIQHQQRRKWARTRRSKKYLAWLAAKQTTLNATGAATTYTVTTAGATATGSITFSGLPVADETVTINGTVYTFKSAIDGPKQILIGVDADGTRDNTITALADEPLIDASSGGAGVVTIDAKVSGEAGNAITLAEAATNTVVSGATLTGGASHSRLTATTHGFADGDGPFFVAAATTQPTGLADNTPYWVVVIDANTIKLAPSQQAAADIVTDPLKDASQLTISSVGVGALTIFKASETDEAMHEWMNILGRRPESHASDILDAETDVDNL
jgi:hypothetical protein